MYIVYMLYLLPSTYVLLSTSPSTHRNEGKWNVSETQMLLSALTQSDTTQFQQFQLRLAHESSSPSAHQLPH